MVTGSQQRMLLITSSLFIVRFNHEEDFRSHSFFFKPLMITFSAFSGLLADTDSNKRLRKRPELCFRQSVHHAICTPKKTKLVHNTLRRQIAVSTDQPKNVLN